MYTKLGCSRWKEPNAKIRTKLGYRAEYSNPIRVKASEKVSVGHEGSWIVTPEEGEAGFRLTNRS
jgi:hypothetical protein